MNPLSTWTPVNSPVTPAPPPPSSASPSSPATTPSCLASSISVTPRTADPTTNFTAAPSSSSTGVSATTLRGGWQWRFQAAVRLTISAGFSLSTSVDLTTLQLSCNASIWLVTGGPNILQNSSEAPCNVPMQPNVSNAILTVMLVCVTALQPQPDYAPVSNAVLKLDVSNICLLESIIATLAGPRQPSTCSYPPGNSTWTATVVADAPPQVVSAQVAQGLGQTAFVASSLAAAAPIAMDVQALAVLGLMHCAPVVPPDPNDPASSSSDNTPQSSFASIRLLSPLSTSDTYAGAVAGHVILLMGLPGVHWLLTRVQLIRKRRRQAKRRRAAGGSADDATDLSPRALILAAQASVRFPHLSLNLLQIFYQPALFVGLQLLKHPSDTGDVLAGLLDLLLGLLVPTIVAIMLRYAVMASYAEIDFEQGLAQAHGWKRGIRYFQWVLPVGRWDPSQSRQRWSSLIGPWNAPRSRAWPLFSLISPTVLVLIAAWEPSTSGGCQAQFSAIAVTQILFALIILLCRPFRNRFGVVGAALSSGALALVSISSAMTVSLDVETVKSGRRLSSVAVPLQLGISALRLVLAVFAKGVEYFGMRSFPLQDQQPGAQWHPYPLPSCLQSCLGRSWITGQPRGLDDDGGFDLLLHGTQTLQLPTLPFPALPSQQHRGFGLSRQLMMEQDLLGLLDQQVAMEQPANEPLDVVAAVPPGLLDDTTMEAPITGGVMAQLEALLLNIDHSPTNHNQHHVPYATQVYGDFLSTDGLVDVGGSTADQLLEGQRYATEAAVNDAEAWGGGVHALHDEASILQQI